jgi:KDO2-lipid IV(A) lauroyltransferase
MGRHRSDLWYRMEYAAVCALAAAARWMGPPRAREAGIWLGRAAYWLAPALRRRALDNLEQADGLTASSRDRRRIARASFEHLASGALEAAAVLSALERLDDERYVAFEAIENWERAHARGRGTIVVLAHLGNWEIAGLAAARRGYPLVSVAQPMKNPYVERFMARARRTTGQRIVSKRGALRGLVDALRRREVVILLCDQRWRHGIAVPFFGRPAATVTTPALLSLRFGAPIVPLEVYRAPRPPIHRVRCGEPLDPECYRHAPDPVRAMTEEITRRIEDAIRRHPEQWMWMHNRWRRWAEHRRGRAGI